MMSLVKEILTETYSDMFHIIYNAGMDICQASHFEKM